MAEYTLEPGEEMLRSVRKHPLIIIGRLIPFALLAWLPSLIPVALGFIAAHAGTILPITTLLDPSNPWFRFVLGIYWLFVWMGAFGAYTDYYLDQFIVTTHRIIRIEQIGFWDREVSTLHMNRVQDVMTDVHGLFAELFGYGMLSIETAGDDPTRFRMDGVRNARAVRDLIMREVTERQEAITPQQHSSGT
jgi:uncharacterized membrane protein YdbT with pleckstrin-like domain